MNNKGLVDWFTNSFKKLFFGVLEVNVDEQFESHKRAEKTIIEYQSMLRSLLEYGAPGRLPRARKVVFFIDELDRCRPNFAVEVIEKVKHLFNVKNVFFVLSINKEQLLSTIASVYGASPEESSIYLQKFVHLETKLPPMIGTDGDSSDHVAEFLKELVAEYEMDDSIISTTLIIDVLSKLSRPSYLDLNPRSLERIMTYISIALSSLDKALANERSRHILVFSALKVGKPDLYESFKDGKIISRSRDGSHKYFDWLRTFDASEKQDEASNVFFIPGVDEACKILDVYEIPSEEFEKQEHAHQTEIMKSGKG